MSFSYIASPYTHTDPAIRHERYRMAKYYTTYALINGQHVYSPIVHCHELAVEFDLPKDIVFWKSYNSAMLCKASTVLILCLNGWDTSEGIKYEVSLANQLCIPIDYILSDEIEIAREFVRAKKAV